MTTTFRSNLIGAPSCARETFASAARGFVSLVLTGNFLAASP
jgi:hypothetical protein